MNDLDDKNLSAYAESLYALFNSVGVKKTVAMIYITADTPRTKRLARAVARMANELDAETEQEKSAIIFGVVCFMNGWRESRESLAKGEVR